MDFSKSPQGSQRAITMRPTSIESTFLLFLLILNFLAASIDTKFVIFFGRFLFMAFGDILFHFRDKINITDLFLSLSLLLLS